MRARIVVLMLLVVVGLSWSAGPAPARTVVTSQSAKKLLLGRHLFSLQWISWNRFGVATVTEKDGTLYITAYQRGFKGKGKNDFVRMKGMIERVDKRSFLFVGTIVTKVYHINGGHPCIRRGPMVFRITGRRQFWRIKQYKNPCADVADYVDIFFKRPRKSR